MIKRFSVFLLAGYSSFGQLISGSPANLAVANLGNGSYAISGTATAGYTYSIQYTADPTQTNWQTLGGTNSGSGGTFTFIDPSGASQRFYRSAAFAVTNSGAGFSPASIPGMAYYWDYHDLPQDVPTTTWTDRLQHVVLNNPNPSGYNQTNTALGVMFPNSGSSSSLLNCPAISVSPGFTLWMVIRERVNLPHGTVPQYSCLFGTTGGSRGLMLNKGVIGCDWGSGATTIGGVMMTNWPIDLVYSQGKVYTNGVALSGSLPQPTGNFKFQTVGDITAGGGNSSPFQGYIQYIGIWTNTVFTAANISNLDNWVNTNGVSNITSGLTAWWKMNDGSGTNIADSSGNGYTSPITGAPTWVNTAPTGGGLLFNGISTFISTPLTASAALSSNFTVVYWERQPTASVYPQQVPIAKGNAAGSAQPGWGVWYEASWIRMLVADGTNYDEMNNQNITSDGRWHQIVWTLGACSGGMPGSVQYVDGELQMQGYEEGQVGVPVAVGSCANNFPVTFGSTPGGAYKPFYNGSLADVRIYTNHVFTSQQVAGLFQWNGQAGQP